MQIDVNCDLGESYGKKIVGNDEAIFPLITSCNIACGFHGGDPQTIENTIKLAVKHNVQIGAHPSYPDLEGFGRRLMQFEPKELMAIIKYQIAAVKGMAESLGVGIKYVKPHGALYNSISNNPEEAKSVVMAVQSVDPELQLMGSAGSIIEDVAKEFDLSFVSEAFGDRRYEPDGKLMSREKEEAVIQDPQTSVDQVLSIVENRQVKTSVGTFIPMHAESICIHGDNLAAVEILKALDRMFESRGIIKKAF